MIELSITELLNSLDSVVLNRAQLDKTTLKQETKILNIVLDSRKVQPGFVFVALLGDNKDSHSFLPKAQQNGALLAIVSSLNENISLPQILVNDTKKALGLITKFLNSKWHKPTVTITGSSGKTTTKFILNAILNTFGQTLCPESSFNNDIGVPLTMFNANEQHWAGIFEMGTNHPGEISYLANLIESKVSILLNVSAGHIGNFKNVDEILFEKSNIFNGLSDNGTAITYHDIDNKDYIINKINELNKTENKNIKLLTFGFNKDADCHADDIKITPTHSEFRLNYNNQSILVNLKLLGQHQILNALAASLAAFSLGLSLGQVKQGLESALPVNKRMQPHQLKDNLVIIDDSYNANPASVAAAMMFLASLQGKKIFILGNLGELGEHSITAHKKIGSLAKEYKINKLLALGDDTKYTLQAFNGESSLENTYFKSKQDLLDNLLNYLSDNSNYADPCTILIKGSNYMRMWEITEQLTEKI